MNNRKLYIDALRIICSFAVIIIHVSSVKWGSTDVLSNEWIINNFYDGITRFAVPVFVMISGTCFLKKTKSFDRILKENCKKIVMVYIFWSAIYAFGLFIATHDRRKAIIRFFEGEDHLWFLFMIMGIYLLIPLLWKIIEEKQTIIYFLLMSFVFSVVLPYLTEVMVLLGLGFISDPFVRMISSMNVKMVLGYTFYFVLGYYIDSVDKSIIVKYPITNIAGILGFGLTVLLSTYYSYFQGAANSFFLGYFSFNVCVESIYVFILVKEYARKPKNEMVSRLVQAISANTLGVYLIHPLILKIVLRVFPHVFATNAFFYIAFVSIVLYILSNIIVFLMRRIPVLRNNFV